ncbi:MAG: ferrous iron transport protein B [Firmicutes bacterium]|nr:ferrous iron transport protein B [Bacillota bacterium]
MAFLISNAPPVAVLAGNPNCGKTALFNAITGSRQRVGNWPGVTVEKRQGTTTLESELVTIVDLPGTYTLGLGALDEKIAREFVVNEHPDVIINVVDATQLERNLYLTIQLLEMDIPMVVALNMFDEAKALDLQIDVDRLKKHLGIPVIPTVATKKQGIHELLFETARLITDAKRTYKHVGRIPDKNRIPVMKYAALEAEIGRLEREISLKAVRSSGSNAHLSLPHRWYAVKQLERNPNTLDIITKARYDRAAGIADSVIGQNLTADEITPSQAIDRLVLHPWLAYPIFLGIIWLMFHITFTFSQPIANSFAEFFAFIGAYVNNLLSSVGTPAVFNDFVVNGIIAGVGAVLEFAPPIFLLFMVITILEDVGYMARAASLSDRLMRAVGLHGGAFIPMILGFGCNVTGILAARGLDDPRDRLISIMVNPLISCAGRLPVYVLFAAAFFTEKRGLVVFSLYILGIFLAALVARIFSVLIKPDSASIFVMELPPYRLPRPGAVFIQTWERGREFLVKAGTVILTAVSVVWLLANLPLGTGPGDPNSYIGRFGTILAPAFRPAGFGDWKAVVALLSGIVAKELIIGTLGVLYGAGTVYGTAETGLIYAIREAFEPLSAYAFLVMSLVYIPCIATLVSIKRETNSWKWMAVSVVYTVLLGWILAVIVYQVGTFLVH